MRLSRRRLLGATAAAAAVGCRRSLPPPVVGGLIGRSDAERGHAGAALPLPSGGPPLPDAVDVLIVGAGIAGLCAGWRLARAGFTGSVAIVELGDAPGGTAQGGDGFPWGAHYVTLPNPGATAYRALLAELGVITSFDGDGRPRFAEAMVCYAPQERLFDGAEWLDGLTPETATPDDHTQLAAFDAVCAALAAAVGADGRRWFEIPVAGSSVDPEARALAAIPFSAWLDANGFDSPVVRWLARYGARDDFGAEPEAISAWAGLHYHCARRPDPAVRDLGTNVITWPEGNAWLVARLAERVPWPIATGAVVHAVDPGDGQVHVGVGDRSLTAKVVIAAVPSRVVARWLPVDQVPDLAPWRVAAVYVDRLPSGRGVPFAWDSVALGARGLGYVHNAHQTGAFRGPAVLTYYDPLSTVAPADGRRALLAATWADERELVLADLAPAHPDLREVVTRVDVRHWGHGTAIPAVGLHATTDWHTTSPHPRVLLAHTDRSGMSLFEEASWHGIRAAEHALGLLGAPLGESLV